MIYKVPAFVIFFFSLGMTHAQNVGIGTIQPVSKLQVEGSFSARSLYSFSSNSPTAGQTYSMINGNTVQIPGTDSVARLYDHGGMAGNYLPNLTGNTLINLNVTNESYLEAIIESINLGTGDSLIIYDNSYASLGDVLLAVGNGYTGTNISLTFSSNVGYCSFKSNADASVGSGFSILFTRKFANLSVPDPINISQKAMVYYPNSAAFRVGAISKDNIGTYSIAMGVNNTASGFNSVALGRLTKASNGHATAMGYETVASGLYATALGYQTQATDEVSTAMGKASWATGIAATAMGERTTASGTGATSMGYYSVASGQYATAIGDGAHASGITAMASGYYTVASGRYATAMGAETHANSYASLAIGRFNDAPASSANSWVSTDRAFVIGDGTSDAARSSAFIIYKNGNGWMQGTLTQASDARLKKNIHKLDQALDKINRLNGYNYYWKDDGNMPGLQSGLLAQEVQQEIPELVTTNTEGELAVNYSGMVPYLLEAIKTQQQQIQTQQEQISLLKKDVEQLKQTEKKSRKKVYR